MTVDDFQLSATAAPLAGPALDATRARPVLGVDTELPARPPPPAPSGLEATTAAMAPLAADEPSPHDLPRGALIGRYVVLDRLGAGGMGVVFAAVDPELDRKVAIKLLRPEIADSGTSGDARARLLREAQALAKLSHPNVVAIFDVGTHGDQVWIAMEFVAGRTLRAWLAERRPEWPELLAVMQAAGHGLAAAHAAGLVHRDIKPDNIMIGDDGRVRVMDFGLARRDAASPSPPSITLDTLSTSPIAASPREVTRPLLAVEVTHAGTMLGTPAYMAPEQFRGETVGPPADVFAFCVMLWEALHGARPFAGETLAELRDAVESQRLVRPARDRAPRWLTAVLLRGLAPAPNQRWPGMDALLAALARGQARTRRRRQVLLAGGLAAAAAITYGGFEIAHQRTLAACERAGDVILDDWSSTRRAALERALLATGSPAAAAVLDKTTPWLDRWAKSWQSAQTQICVAHDIDRTLDDELHSRAGDCLDELRGNFVALLDTLAEPDAQMLTRATPAAASLPPVAACTDPATLRARPPVSREQRGEIAAIRSQLARASSLLHVGNFAAGLEIAKDALTTAAPWPALVAAAEYRAGTLESELGEFPAAEQSFLRALAAAREARASEVAVDSMTMLAYVVGDKLTRFAEGKVWAEAARTEILHVAGDARPLTGQLDLNLAQIHRAQGTFDEALRLNERALATWTETFGEDHPLVAQVLNNLAIVHLDRGAYTDALAMHERALALREQALGTDHPQVATTLSNMGTVLLKLGRDADARQVLERALALRERALEPTHPQRIESLNNLANVHYTAGAHAEALRLYEQATAALAVAPAADARMRATLHYNCGLIHTAQCRDAEAAREHTLALELFESVLGATHPTLAHPLHELGNSRLQLGALDEGLRLHQRGLDIRRAALGEDHPELVASLFGVATARRMRGELTEALDLGERALALVEATMGEGHPAHVYALGALADTLLAARRPREALPRIERALALNTADDSPPEKHLNFHLARALWDTGGDRTRARTLARDALDALSAAGTCEPELAPIRDWLAAHPE